MLLTCAVPNTASCRVGQTMCSVSKAVVLNGEMRYRAIFYLKDGSTW